MQFATRCIHKAGRRGDGITARVYAVKVGRAVRPHQVIVQRGCATQTCVLVYAVAGIVAKDRVADGGGTSGKVDAATISRRVVVKGVVPHRYAVASDVEPAAIVGHVAVKGIVPHALLDARAVGAVQVEPTTSLRRVAVDGVALPKQVAVSAGVVIVCTTALATATGGGVVVDKVPTHSRYSPDLDVQPRPVTCDVSLLQVKALDRRGDPRCDVNHSALPTGIQHRLVGRGVG